MGGIPTVHMVTGRSTGEKFGPHRHRHRLVASSLVVLHVPGHRHKKPYPRPVHVCTSLNSPEESVSTSCNFILVGIPTPVKNT